MTKPALVGINHVALEVGDVDEALAFYGSIFDFRLRGRGEGRAFIDIGDQFLALMKADAEHRDRQRHFGLVVDDRSSVRNLAVAAGATILEGNFLDFLDPWGNRIEVVEYRDVQFLKSDAMLDYLKVSHDKSDASRAELNQKLAREDP